ncbi:50S ribosomal protein L14e [Candidatus Woesearchaeota archaeon]|nr:50S ribosomal protein L14e [Candidatus Woesearchaeota archaeon]
MIDIGRIIVKIAGRDARQSGCIVEVIDDTYVLIDGNVRRKKVNVKHLHFSEKTLKIKKGAKTEEVHKAMKSAGLKVVEKKKRTKTKQKSDKPTKHKKIIKTETTEKKTSKKAVKKTIKKATKKTVKKK